MVTNATLYSPSPARRGSPAFPTPRVAWALALGLALLAAVGIVYPKVGAVLLGLLVAGFVGSRILLRPINGILVALCIFPLYPMLRAAYTAFGIPIAVSGTRLWPEMTLAVVFLGIVAGSIVQRRRLRLYGDDLPPLLYLCGGLYGIILSLSYLPPMAALMGFHVSLTSTLFYFAVRWANPSRDDYRRVLSLLLFSYTVLAVLSLVAFVFRPMVSLQLADATRPYFVPPGIPALPYWKIYPRMQSLLFDENVWGSLSALVSLFCLANFVIARPSRLLTGLFFLSTLCVVCSMSRGSMLAWVIGVVVLLLLRGQHQRRIIALLVSVVALGGWGMFALARDARVIIMLERVEKIGFKTGEVASDRTHQWEAGWDIFKRNPSGTGLGTAGYAAFLSQVGEMIVGDSTYFRVLAEQGVPGLVVLLLTMSGTAWVLLRHLPATQGRQRALGMTLIAFLCGTCAHSVVATTWDYYYVMPVFWTLVGLYVARQLAEARQSGGPQTPSRPL